MCPNLHLVIFRQYFIMISAAQGRGKTDFARIVAGPFTYQLYFFQPITFYRVG